MKKSIVIYKSKYGYTKKYAAWIAEELEAELKDVSEIKTSELSPYDLIIYGGGLYAGGVSGLSFLKKSFSQIKDKQVVLFTVGVANTQDEENIKTIRKSLSRALTPEMQDKIELFHLRGGIDYPRLNFIHRIMMSMLVKMLRRKAQSEIRAEDRLMIETYGQVIDFTNKDDIYPIVEQIKLYTGN
ncbi:MAG: flavodoxin [Bacteroidales bacterium]|nr:flavodoxin [Bacteroidales bacterium]